MRRRSSSRWKRRSTSRIGSIRTRQYSAIQWPKPVKLWPWSSGIPSDANWLIVWPQEKPPAIPPTWQGMSDVGSNWEVWLEFSLQSSLQFKLDPLTLPLVWDLEISQGISTMRTRWQSKSHAYSWHVQVHTVLAEMSGAWWILWKIYRTSPVTEGGTYFCTRTFVSM
jgi:hypothetical protein